MMFIIFHDKGGNHVTTTFYEAEEICQVLNDMDPGDTATVYEAKELYTIKRSEPTS